MVTILRPTARESSRLFGADWAASEPATVRPRVANIRMRRIGTSEWWRGAGRAETGRDGPRRAEPGTTGGSWRGQKAEDLAHGAAALIRLEDELRVRGS